MAMFPKIQSPCPYKNQLATIMDGDMCRMCDRQVFDLSGMSDGERVSFLNGCAEEVCVSYRFPVRPALAAAVLAIATIATPMAAAAQDYDVVEIIVGGIKDTANIEYVQDAADSAIPELPVVYEDGATEQAAAPDKDQQAAASTPVRTQAAT